MLRLDKVWNNQNSRVAIESRTVDGEETIRFPPSFQFTNQLEHLCECLTTGSPHRIPPENSVSQMKVIDAVFESLATGNVAELSREENPDCVG